MLLFSRAWKNKCCYLISCMNVASKLNEVSFHSDSSCAFIFVDMSAQQCLTGTLIDLLTFVNAANVPFAPCYWEPREVEVHMCKLKLSQNDLLKQCNLRIKSWISADLRAQRLKMCPWVLVLYVNLKQRKIFFSFISSLNYVHIN